MRIGDTGDVRFDTVLTEADVPTLRMGSLDACRPSRRRSEDIMTNPPEAPSVPLALTSVIASGVPVDQLIGTPGIVVDVVPC